MKKIKFDSSVFELVDDVNCDGVHFQATVFKGNYTVDTIATAVRSASTIKVYNDEELVGEYTGFTTAIAFVLHYLDDGTGTVSIELENVNVLSQIASLQSQVDTHNDEIASIDAGVADLANEITTVNEGMDELNESQLSQDAAIEDLAEGMAEMAEV